MKLATMIKGQNGRWRVQLNLFKLYFTLSNTPVRFRSRQDAFIGQKERQKLKLMLLARRGNKCESCGYGGDEKTLELHHIKPILERPDLAKSPDNQQWLETCRQADIPALSKDTCARLLAIIGVIGGSMEAFTHNKKLIADWKYAQKRFHIEGGEIPDPEGAELIKKYYHELMDYYNSAPRNEQSESPMAVVHPQWVVDMMKERYGIEKLWI